MELDRCEHEGYNYINQVVRVHPTLGSPNMNASSLMPGIIVVHVKIYAWSSEYGHDIGLQASKGAGTYDTNCKTVTVDKSRDLRRGKRYKVS